MRLGRAAIRLAKIALLGGASLVSGCRRSQPAPTTPPFAWSAAPVRSSLAFEDEIRAFEAEDRRSPPRPGGILFVGSSSIRLWRSLADDFKPYPVINRGFGGSQISNVIDFGRRVVLPYAPARIVFFAGSNDIDAGASAAKVLADFKTFVAGVHEMLPATRIAFISITTSPLRFHEIATVREANRLVREYVETDPKLTFIDVFPAMLDGAGRPRPELYLEDRLHPSRRGYRSWIPLIEPFLRD